MNDELTVFHLDGRVESFIWKSDAYNANINHIIFLFRLGLAEVQIIYSGYEEDIYEMCWYENGVDFGWRCKK